MTAGNPEGREGAGRGRKRTALAAILLAVALCALGAGGYMLWKSQQPASDPGATVRSYEGMSDEEIRADLDRQVEESRMTISVSPKPRLDGDRVRVNVVNVEGHRFDQRFTLEQGGKTLYESGSIAPGETVEWCDAPGAAEGEAAVTVQALDPGTASAHGNPQSVAVEIAAAG